MAARSPALKGLGASDRDRARWCDPAKRDAALWLRALIAVEHEMQMKCELTLHEPRELTLSFEDERVARCIQFAMGKQTSLGGL